MASKVLKTISNMIHQIRCIVQLHLQTLLKSILGYVRFGYL